MPASFNYYEILGLDSTAGAAEIKAAYRKLAMRYHPDTNPDPDAHKQFVAINAAYEVLGDPLKKRMYDLRQSAGEVIFRTPERRRAPHQEPVDHEEMRRRYWESPAGQRKKRQMAKEANFFNKVSFFLKILSIPLCIFFLLILGDGWMSKKIPNQLFSYIGMKPTESGKFYSYYMLGEEQIRISAVFENCLDVEKPVTLYRSPIFNIITKMEVNNACEQADTTFDPYRSLYSGSGFLIYLALALIVVLWNKKLAPHFAVGIGFFLLALSGVVMILFSRLLI